MDSDSPQTPDPGTAAVPLEIEWQFDTPDLDRVARWVEQGAALRADALGEREHRDRYLDTPDWRVERAGYTLRMRASLGGVEATLKSTGGGDAGLRRRREWNEPLDGPAAGNPAMLRCAPGPVGSRIAALVGDLPLRELFTVRTARRRYLLHDADGHAVAEVALDRSTCVAGDACGEPLLRVEVEALREDAEPLLALYVSAMREACALVAAGRSKFECGLAVAGLHPPGPRPAPREATHAGMRIAELAHDALRRQLAALLAAEPGTRLGDDAEPLHDMRVAVRRMRTAIDLFADVTDPALAPLDAELRWVNESLSPLRDLDVQMGRFAAWRAPDGSIDPVLSALLAGRREAARARMLATLESPRYAALIANATAALLRPRVTRAAARRHARLVAPKIVARHWRRVAEPGKRLAPRAADAAYHAVRIRAKRARYATEFVAGLYGKPARRFQSALVALQDVLGEHQDAVVAIADLDALIAAEGERLRPETVAAVRAAQDEFRAAIADRRARFPAALRRARKRWKPLARRMRRERRRAG